MINHQGDETFNRTALLIHGLSIYDSIKEDKLVNLWQNVVESIAYKLLPRDILKSYHNFCSQANTKNWPEHLIDLILEADNCFALKAAADPYQIDRSIKDQTRRDLHILEQIAGIKSSQIKDAATDLFKQTIPNLPDDDPLSPINWPAWEKPFLQTPENPLNPNVNNSSGSLASTWLYTKKIEIKSSLLSGSWQDKIEELALYYHQAGLGLFSSFPACRWERLQTGGQFAGITNPDPIKLDQLIGLTREQSIILDNTEHFLNGLPANNILLYGDRGTGKSSVVKALVHKYISFGLRLVEIAKADLIDIPVVMRLLAAKPQKFIIFIDDLSFEESEFEYKALKTMLEGGIEARPGNVLIYATSNRRHLVKENFSDRQGDEIHASDSYQEKLSLADRFGITVTFPAPDQEDYLKIVEGLALRHHLDIEKSQLRQIALQWQMYHNGRSGRTARQFVDHLIAKNIQA